jgi:hypothetical protein
MDLKKGVQWVKDLTSEDLQVLEELPLSLYIPVYGESGGAHTSNTILGRYNASIQDYWVLLHMQYYMSCIAALAAAAAAAAGRTDQSEETGSQPSIPITC